MSIDHTARLVLARRAHQCHETSWAAPGCTRTINAGEWYVRSTIFPGHDSGYAGDPGHGHPVSAALCLPCAANYTDTAAAALSRPVWRNRPDLAAMPAQGPVLDELTRSCA